MNGRLKKALFALGMIALLAVDSWATWRFVPRGAIQAGSAGVFAEAERDPLDAFKLEREQLRAKREAQLNDVIHSERSDSETVRDAQRRLADLLANAQSELTIESLLKGRGFEDALVSVSDASANVLVRGEALTQQETAVILELVMRETGLTGGNVKIIPVK